MNLHIIPPRFVVHVVSQRGTAGGGAHTANHPTTKKQAVGRFKFLHPHFVVQSRQRLEILCMRSPRNQIMLKLRGSTAS